MQPPNKITQVMGFQAARSSGIIRIKIELIECEKAPYAPKALKFWSSVVVFYLALTCLLFEPGWPLPEFQPELPAWSFLYFGLFVLLWILLHCVTLVSSLSFGCIRCGSCESQLLLFPHPSLVKTFLWKVRSIQTHFSLGFIWKRPTAIQSSHHRELKEGHVSGLKQKKGERTFKNQIGFWL